MNSFIEIEKQYWDLAKSIDLFEYIIPVNLKEEKYTFLHKLEKNDKYNPVFKYKPIWFNKKNTINQLLTLDKKFNEYNNMISVQYKGLIEEDIEWVNNLYKRDSHDFKNWLSSLYGKPTENLYNSAVNKAKSIYIKNSNKYQITPIEIRGKLIRKLKEMNIANWNIEVKDSSARLSVNSVTKTITIKHDAKFSLSEINRLFVHEIGTHILRYENGSKQRYLLFKKGFPGYLKTEEGLAILSESKTNLLTPIDTLKYSVRLIASYLCFSCDFWDLFKTVNDYLNKDDSFDIVARIKRGLTYTKHLGGFTKDQLYYTGFKEIKKLPINELRKLYLGKIGVENLDIIDKLSEINLNIIIPEWFENDK